VQNGYGLLQAVQHFGLAGKSMTFNFVHFSIQQFFFAMYTSLILNYAQVKEMETDYQLFWTLMVASADQL